MNIFVGNLSFEANEGDVKSLFEGFGAVASVAIVMRKEKKAPKSRGFGFVDMPDDAQALAAIEGLNGKEFMGRPLNVNPARSKEATLPKSDPQDNGQSQVAVEKVSPQKTWVRRPVFNKPGTFRGGRRTVSYMKRRGESGMQDEFKPRKRSEDNPMRWRKKRDQVKPWAKGPGGYQPWKKAEGGEARPWKKPEGDAKPWKKPAGDAKPWKKTGGEFKPWKKSAGDARPWKKTAGEARAWKKPAGEFKPWKKSAGDARPWKKTTGDALPRSKSYRRPPKSGFKGSRKPGGYKR